MKKKFENVKNHVMRYLPEYTVGGITIAVAVAIWKSPAEMWIVDEPEILYEQVTPLGTIQVIAPE